MKKITILSIVFLLAFFFITETNAETILFEGFEDNSGFTTAGFAQGYWGIAPLSGTPSIPSNYIQGGSQSGNIFFGSFGKDFSNLDVSPTMTIKLPDLSKYTDLTFTVALAAPYTYPTVMWEIGHRDKLVIDSNISNIDTFRPISNASPLQSIYSFTNLGYTFQDFQYSLGSNVNSITFTFASTDYPETVGIDSVRITGNIVLPSVEQILSFFDTALANGTLTGEGPGNSADGRLKALRNMIEAAGDLIAVDDLEKAYQQLMDAYKKTDGDSHIPDFVDGEAADELAQMILELGNSLEQTTSFALSTSATSHTPLPPTVWLLGSGLLGLVGWRRFRKN